MRTTGKIMKHFFTIASLLIITSVSGQSRLDTAKVEMILLSLPDTKRTDKEHENIIKVIEAVDKKYRQISDTLFSYKSLSHTIFQTVLIETNDSLFINPLSLGNSIQLSNIIFNNSSLNTNIKRISEKLNTTDREELFLYLKNNFDHFSVPDKQLNAQPVRIKYIKFQNENLSHVGIDIYGAQFLWTVEMNRGWDIIKVERLLNY